MMQREDSERLVEAWAKAVETGAPGAFATLVTSDVTDLSGPVPACGPEPFEARARALHAAFGALRVTIDALVVEGERLAWRFTVEGEHRGPFLGVEPTGRRIALRGVNFQSIVDGRVREHFTLIDRFGALQALRPT